MRAIPSFAVLALTACLIAPSKPSARSDAGGGDGDGGGGGGGGGENDGGNVSPFGSGCLGPEDVAGPAIAFDLRGSGSDSVFRGGVTGSGVPMIWRFDPPVDNTACPSYSFELSATPNATSVDALSIAPNATSFGGATILFAAVTVNTDAAVYELTLSSDGTVTSASDPVASGLAPRAVSTYDGSDTFSHLGSDYPAFVHLIDVDQVLWVGGGASLGAVQIDANNSHPFEPIGLGSGPFDPVYGIAEISDGSSHTGLVAATKSYELQDAQVNPVEVVVTDAVPHTTAGCDSTPRCHGRIFTIPHPESAPVYASVSVDRETGDYATFSVGGSPDEHSLGTSVPHTPYLISDAAADTFLIGQGPSLATLWIDTSGAQPPRVFLYTGIGSSEPNAPTVIDLGAERAHVTRLLGLRRSGGIYRMLMLLADHPGASLHEESCVHPDLGGDLGACDDAQ
jgi:hypothetical protein